MWKVGLYLYLFLQPMYNAIALIGIYESRYTNARVFILKSLCLIYLLHFLSVKWQCKGLFCESGLAPLSKTLSSLSSWSRSVHSRRIWSVKYMTVPMTTLLLSYFGDRKEGQTYLTKLYRILNAGILVSIAGLIFPTSGVMMFLWIVHYIIKRLGGNFFSLQWDILLLEFGFIAIPLSIESTPLTQTFLITSLQILHFRLMFGSGISKYYSPDTSWNDHSATSYHFLTQPLPRNMAWILHSMPLYFHKVLTFMVVKGEIFLPLLTLIPFFQRDLAPCYLLLQLCIHFTGNFGIFNLLSAALAVSFIDDQHYIWGSMSFFPSYKDSISISAMEEVAYFDIETLEVVGLIKETLCLFVGGLIFLSMLLSAISLMQRMKINFTIPPAIDVVQSWGIPFYVGIYNYGLFANMTKIRNELTIYVQEPDIVTKKKTNNDQEGEEEENTIDENTGWYPVYLKYKPGNPSVTCKVVAPVLGMPRLDWRLWFLPLSRAEPPIWFFRLLANVLDGQGGIEEFIEENKDKPTFAEGSKIRVLVENYQFNYNKGTGKFWNVSPVREYISPKTLEQVLELIHIKEDAAKIQSEEKQKRQAVNVLGKLAKKIGAVRRKNNEGEAEKVGSDRGIIADSDNGSKTKAQ